MELSVRRCHLLKSEEKEGRGGGQGSGFLAYKMYKMKKELNLFEDTTLAGLRDNDLRKKWRTRQW